MSVRDACPACGATRFKKHGHPHNGTQHQPGQTWPRQLGPGSAPYLIAEDQRGRIARVLVERLALRGRGRAVGVTRKGLWGVLVPCGAAWPDHLQVQPVACPRAVLRQRLEVEADALASCVQQKAPKQWVWMARDATSRQVMAVHVGDRSPTSAEPLGAQMPHASRPHATLYTAREVGYEKVIPAAQHRAISPLARNPQHVERFNTTLRQRGSRWGREAWSLSKKLANHLGAIKLCIGHYNLTRAAA